MSANRHHQAFPSTRFDGLTRRDYFAALAMQGILSNAFVTEAGLSKMGAVQFYLQSAEAAVTMADTLLAELEKPR